MDNTDTPQHFVSNLDLLERMEKMEIKMDNITQRLEQATGAWLFIKIMGSIIIGCTVIWNAASHYFKG